MNESAKFDMTLNETIERSMNLFGVEIDDMKSLLNHVFSKKKEGNIKPEKENKSDIFVFALGQMVRTIKEITGISKRSGDKSFSAKLSELFKEDVDGTYNKDTSQIAEYVHLCSMFLWRERAKMRDYFHSLIKFNGSAEIAKETKDGSIRISPDKRNPPMVMRTGTTNENRSNFVAVLVRAERSYSFLEYAECYFHKSFIDYLLTFPSDQDSESVELKVTPASFYMLFMRKALKKRITYTKDPNIGDTISSTSLGQEGQFLSQALYDYKNHKMLNGAFYLHSDESGNIKSDPNVFLSRSRSKMLENYKPKIGFGIFPNVSSPSPTKLSGGLTQKKVVETVRHQIDIEVLINQICNKHKESTTDIMKVYELLSADDIFKFLDMWMVRLLNSQEKDDIQADELMLKYIKRAGILTNRMSSLFVMSIRGSLFAPFFDTGKGKGLDHSVSRSKNLGDIRLFKDMNSFINDIRTFKESLFIGLVNEIVSKTKIMTYTKKTAEDVTVETQDSLLRALINTETISTVLAKEKVSKTWESAESHIRRVMVENEYVKSFATAQGPSFSLDGKAFETDSSIDIKGGRKANLSKISKTRAGIESSKRVSEYTKSVIWEKCLSDSSGRVFASAPKNEVSEEPLDLAGIYTLARVGMHVFKGVVETCSKLECMRLGFSPNEYETVRNIKSTEGLYGILMALENSVKGTAILPQYSPQQKNEKIETHVLSSIEEYESSQIKKLLSGATVRDENSDIWNGVVHFSEMRNMLSKMFFGSPQVAEFWKICQICQILACMYRKRYPGISAIFAIREKQAMDAQYEKMNFMDWTSANEQKCPYIFALFSLWKTTSILRPPFFLDGGDLREVTSEASCVGASVNLTESLAFLDVWHYSGLHHKATMFAMEDSKVPNDIVSFSKDTLFHRESGILIQDFSEKGLERMKKSEEQEKLPGFTRNNSLNSVVAEESKNRFITGCALLASNDYYPYVMKDAHVGGELSLAKYCLENVKRRFSLLRSDSDSIMIANISKYFSLDNGKHSPNWLEASGVETTLKVYESISHSSKKVSDSISPSDMLRLYSRNMSLYMSDKDTVDILRHSKMNVDKSGTASDIDSVTKGGNFIASVGNHISNIFEELLLKSIMYIYMFSETYNPSQPNAVTISDLHSHVLAKKASFGVSFGFFAKHSLLRDLFEVVEDLHSIYLSGENMFGSDGAVEKQKETFFEISKKENQEHVSHRLDEAKLGKFRSSRVENWLGKTEPFKSIHGTIKNRDPGSTVAKVFTLVSFYISLIMDEYFNIGGYTPSTGGHDIPHIWCKTMSIGDLSTKPKPGDLASPQTSQTEGSSLGSKYKRSQDCASDDDCEFLEELELELELEPHEELDLESVLNMIKEEIQWKQ